ncbi:MAG TPA: tripartite tricarboxylate transporter substrate binding protein [Burkholderiales bacterium]|nr:tripartite tricarboxylate transporter substrate binding protein [Burkholderiales bacterium]
MNVTLKVVVTSAVSILVMPVFAQNYPSKAIRVVVSVPAGGTPDVLARAVTPNMATMLGQQLVLDNRGGAGGRIAAETVAGATPDGYTLFMTSPPCLTILPHMSKVPYNTLTDFIPISLIATGSMLLLTHPSSPITSVKDLIVRAKSAPAKLNYASAGSGTANHIGMEIFKAIAGVNITHVPYAGAPQSVIDLIAGRVDVMLNSVPPALPHVKTGKLRALGLAGNVRSPLLPDVPTVDEAAGLQGVQAGSWLGLLAPAGTPRPIVARLNAVVVKVLGVAETRSRLIGIGGDPVGNSPQEFAAFLRTDYEKNGVAVKQAGLKVE